MSDHEWERLHALYASLDDGEISRLYEQRADLTEIAQQVLTDEFKSRGLIPAADEAESSSVDVQGDGTQVGLSEFGDAIEANEVLAVLERHEIEASLRPGRSLERTDGSQVVVWQLFVEKTHKDEAIRLLRKHKGMFPLPEQQSDERYLPDETDLFVVAEFDNAEDAALAEQGLADGSVRFRKHEEEHEGQTVWTFEVAQDDVERAGEAMELAFRSADVEVATED